MMTKDFKESYKAAEGDRLWRSSSIVLKVDAEVNYQLHRFGFHIDGTRQDLIHYVLKNALKDSDFVKKLLEKAI